MKNYILNESELRKIIRKSILEQSGEMGEGKNKPRCVPENVIPLDEIVGNASDFMEQTTLQTQYI